MKKKEYKALLKGIKEEYAKRQYNLKRLRKFYKDLVDEMLYGEGKSGDLYDDIDEAEAKINHLLKIYGDQDSMQIDEANFEAAIVSRMNDKAKTKTKKK